MAWVWDVTKLEKFRNVTGPVTLEKVYPADGMDEIHFDFFGG